MIQNLEDNLGKVDDDFFSEWIIGFQDDQKQFLDSQIAFSFLELIDPTRIRKQTVNDIDGVLDLLHLFGCRRQELQPLIFVESFAVLHLILYGFVDWNNLDQFPNSLLKWFVLFFEHSKKNLVEELVLLDHTLEFFYSLKLRV